MSDEVKEAVAAAVAEATKGFEAEKAKMAAKLDELLGETKEAKRKAKEAEEAKARELEEAHKKSGDVAALEKSWQDKLAKRESELAAERDAMSGHLRAATVNATAIALAAELAVPGSASVLLPHIERRLNLEVREGKPVVTVLDKNGQPSASTVAELRKEIESDAAFAPLIVASKASGAGGPGGKGGGAAKKEITRAAFESLDANARADHFRTGGTITD